MNEFDLPDSEWVAIGHLTEDDGVVIPVNVGNAFALVIYWD